MTVEPSGVIQPLGPSEKLLLERPEALRPWNAENHRLGGENSTAPTVSGMGLLGIRANCFDSCPKEVKLLDKEEKKCGRGGWTCCGYVGNDRLPRIEGRKENCRGEFIWRFHIV